MSQYQLNGEILIPQSNVVSKLSEVLKQKINNILNENVLKLAIITCINDYNIKESSKQSTKPTIYRPKAYKSDY